MLAHNIEQQCGFGSALLCIVLSNVFITPRRIAYYPWLGGVIYPQFGNHCFKDLYHSQESKKTLSHKIGSFGQLPRDDDIIQM